MRAAFIALLFGSSAAAFAGTVIEGTTTDVRTKKPIDSTRLAVQDGKIRFERASAVDPEDRSVVLFADQRLYVVDDRQKAYRVMDRAAVEQIEAARAADLAEAGGGAQKTAAAKKPRRPIAPEPKLADTGRTKKVGAHTCRVWNATLQGRTVAQHCVVPAAKLGGGPDLAPTLKAFAGFWNEVAAEYPGLAESGRLARTFQKADGVPVETTTYAGGKPQETARVTAVRTENVAPAQFAVPKGYERMNMVREAEAP